MQTFEVKNLWLARRFSYWNPGAPAGRFQKGDSHVESVGLPRCPPGREGGQGEGQLLCGLVRPGRPKALSKLRTGGGGPECGLQAPREAASRAAERHLREQRQKNLG